MASVWLAPMGVAQGPEAMFLRELVGCLSRFEALCKKVTEGKAALTLADVRDLQSDIAWYSTNTRFRSYPEGMLSQLLARANAIERLLAGPTLGSPSLEEMSRDLCLTVAWLKEELASHTSL